jgi:magnesium transporter
MMEAEATRQPWEELAELVESGDSTRVISFLDSLSPSETARTLSRIEREDRERLLQMLPPEEAARVIHDLPDEQAADALEELRPAVAADILEEMPSDDRADVFSDLEADTADAVLQSMEPEEAEEIREIIQYPEASAAGVMVTEYLAYHEAMSVEQVLLDLRLRRDELTDYDVQYLYVISEQEVLLGVVPLRDLVLASRDTPIYRLMIDDPLSVELATTLDDLVEIFDDYDYVGVPAIDERRRLVGVVLRENVEEAVSEEASGSFLKFSGIVGGEELRSMPVHQRSARRLSWLSINIVLNIIAASVIAMYQDTLAAVIALAVFLPIISDMSGCSGNQAVAVSLRELTLGLVKPFEVLRVVAKEAVVGVINGLALGALLSAAALFWKGNPYLGLVVGGALAINTVVAVCLGGALPLVLKRLRLDPALASGPILTTVTDMCGFFIVLSMATVALPLLRG